MKCLEEFAQFKARMERELRIVAVARDRSSSKRIKSQMEHRIAEFERNMLGLKKKWHQILENVFHRISDTEIYDKLTRDLIKSFEKIHDRLMFEGDHIDYAIRCIIIPISGQIMDEYAEGTQAFIRQERRARFLVRLLNGNDAITPDQSAAAATQHNASSDPEATNSSGSNTTSERSLPTSGSSIRVADSTVKLSQDEVVEATRPTFMTITILDVLFEAIEKHSRLNPEDRSFAARVCHIANISYVVDILTKYLDDVIKQLTAISVQESTDERRLRWITILKGPMCRYKKKLEECIDLLDDLLTVSYYRKQLNLLLLRVMSINSELKC